MSIKISELKKQAFIETAIIHSVDLALYNASVIIDGEEHYVVNAQNLPLRANNKMELQALFEKMNVGSMRLRHVSAYDEMIGQPERLQENTLDVPLGNHGIGQSKQVDEH